MARTYIIRKRDTLAKIANFFYKDAGLVKMLAGYNGILNPDLIQAGQTIEVPSRRELEGHRPATSISGPAAVPQGLVAPAGLEQIIAAFGNIYDYLQSDGSLDPRWESDQLGRAPLPFSLPLSWDQTKMAKSVYCHKKLIPVFTDVFTAVQGEGLESRLTTYGGCYNFRGKRTGGKLSTHSWGIAIDLNPETNAQGSSGNMDEGIVDIFRRFGFKWGGDWTGKTKDPMHFQFCTGY